MDFSIITQTYPKYFMGLLTTLKLLSISLIVGMFLAVTCGVMRSAKSKLLYLPAWSFIYFFRGTPLLVQLYLIYYGLPQFEIVRDTFLWNYFSSPIFCALLALSLNNAAYTGEIIYNGILTVGKGEIEAAKAYGMTSVRLLRLIVLPSVMFRSIPAYTNEVIFMLHATALVSLVTISDLTGVARGVYSKYYAPFEAFLFAALFYMCITFTIAFFMRKLERRLVVFRGVAF